MQQVTSDLTGGAIKEGGILIAPIPSDQLPALAQLTLKTFEAFGVSGKEGADKATALLGAALYLNRTLEMIGKGTPPEHAFKKGVHALEEHAHEFVPRFIEEATKSIVHNDRESRQAELLASIRSVLRTVGSIQEREGRTSALLTQDLHALREEITRLHQVAETNQRQTAEAAHMAKQTAGHAQELRDHNLNTRRVGYTARQWIIGSAIVIPLSIGASYVANHIPLLTTSAPYGVPPPNAGVGAGITLEIPCVPKGGEVKYAAEKIAEFKAQGIQISGFKFQSDCVTAPTTWNFKGGTTLRGPLKYSPRPDRLVEPNP